MTILEIIHCEGCNHDHDIEDLERRRLDLAGFCPYCGHMVLDENGQPVD